MNINLAKIKVEFATHFPESSLTKILLCEPDDMAPEVFLAKVATWLNIVNTEKKG